MQHDVVCDLICEFLSFISKSLKNGFNPNHESLLKHDLNQNHKLQEMI